MVTLKPSGRLFSGPAAFAERAEANTAMQAKTTVVNIYFFMDIPPGSDFDVIHYSREHAFLNRAASPVVP
jgi:hypothetical protein